MIRIWGIHILKILLLEFLIGDVCIKPVMSQDLIGASVGTNLDSNAPGVKSESALPENHIFEENALEELIPETKLLSFVNEKTLKSVKKSKSIMLLISSLNKAKNLQSKIEKRAEIYYRKNHSTADALHECISDIKGVQKAMNQFWMQPFLDASAKLPSGILLGNFFWYGAFEQCRKFKTPKKNAFGLDFKGQYCTIRLPLALSNKVLNGTLGVWKLGVCVPDSCGTDELNALLRIIHQIPSAKKVLGNISALCVPEYVPYDYGSLVVLFILGMSLLFIAFATICDKYHLNFCNIVHYALQKGEILQNEKDSHFSLTSENSQIIIETKNDAHSKKNTFFIFDDWKSELDWRTNIEALFKASLYAVQHYDFRTFPLHCFSAIRNLDSIFDTSGSKEDLECIRGIRAISMFWIILGHTYLGAMSVSNNYLDVAKEVKSKRFQTVLSSFYAVDTFYTLSGFLLAYLTFKKLPVINFKWIAIMITHRYWRLIPVYLMILLMRTTVFNIIGNGPIWDLLPNNREMCEKYWWRNILFINNLFPTAELCVSVSWYIANDMQFFVISPLFFYVLSRKKVKYYNGVLVMILFIVLALFIRAYIAYQADIWEEVKAPVDLILVAGKNVDFGKQIYQVPWSRIGPFIIGYLVGYLQFRIREKIKITKVLVILGWATSGIAVYFLFYECYNYEMGKPLLVLYLTTTRSIWSICVSWVLFTSLNGYGGAINSFLSAKIWIPFARLSYCVYLIHPMVIEYYFLSLKAPFHSEHHQTLLLYLGFTAVSYVLALLMSITFEAPLMKLEKHFIKIQ